MTDQEETEILRRLTGLDEKLDDAARALNDTRLKVAKIEGRSVQCEAHAKSIAEAKVAAQKAHERIDREISDRQAGDDGQGKQSESRHGRLVTALLNVGALLVAAAAAFAAWWK